MKAYYNLQQQTAEWLEIRWAKISGTRSGGLFIKSDNLLDEILAEKCEDFNLWDSDNDYQSADMIRGNELQGPALLALTEYTGVTFKACGWLQCEENELLGISPDGIDETETICAEVKCPGAKRHYQTIKANDIPNDNVKQALHYFTVNNKLATLYFCSFRPENKYKPLFVKELNRDSLINIGTEKKPVMISISEAVILAKKEADSTLAKSNEILKTLSF